MGADTRDLLQQQQQVVPSQKQQQQQQQQKPPLAQQKQPYPLDEQQQQQQPRPSRRANRNFLQQRHHQDQQDQPQQQHQQFLQQPRTRNRTNPQRRPRQQQQQQQQQTPGLPPWDPQTTDPPTAERPVGRVSRASRRDAAAAAVVGEAGVGAAAAGAAGPASPAREWVSGSLQHPLQHSLQHSLQHLQHRCWQRLEGQQREDYRAILPLGGLASEALRVRLDHGYPLDVRGGGPHQPRLRPAPPHCGFLGASHFCLPLLGLAPQGPHGGGPQPWAPTLPFEATPTAPPAAASLPPVQQCFYVQGPPTQQQRGQQPPQQHVQHQLQQYPTTLPQLPPHHLHSSSDYPFLSMMGVPTRPPFAGAPNADGSSSSSSSSPLQPSDTCNTQMLASEADPVDFSAAPTAGATETRAVTDTAAAAAPQTPSNEGTRPVETARYAAVGIADKREGGSAASATSVAAGAAAAAATAVAAATTSPAPGLNGVVALGASVGCPTPYAVMSEAPLQQQSWQHLSHPYWQSWQLQQQQWQQQLQQQQLQQHHLQQHQLQHHQLQHHQLQQQQWQQWQQQWQQWQQQWQQWQRMDMPAYSYLPVQQLQQQQVQQQQQYVGLIQQQRQDWGPQRPAGTNRSHQRAARRGVQQQHHQQQHQAASAPHCSSAAGPRRGLQRQWQQSAFPVGGQTADCMPHIPSESCAAAAAAAAAAGAAPVAAYPLPVQAPAAGAPVCEPTDNRMTRTPGRIVAVAPACSYATAVRSGPATSSPQSVQQQQRQQHGQWVAQARIGNRNIRDIPCRPRSVQEERRLVDNTQQLVEGPLRGCRRRATKSTPPPAPAAGAPSPAGGSTEGLTALSSNTSAATTSAAVTTQEGGRTGSGNSSSSALHSGRCSRRSSMNSRPSSNRNCTRRNSTRSLASSRMLPEEGYAYTKNMAYLAPLVEAKKVGPGDFVLLHVIGKGSYGKVMLVRFEQDGQLYALKVLLKESLLRRSQVQHTRTERAVLEAISHPFIVQMHFAFQTPKKLYFVLDLKSENVLLDVEGHIRLTDFGLSKSGIADNNSARSVCGTPEYIAPEILCQVGHGKAADWWSLGALLYEMLTGLPPFYTANRQALFTNILWGGLEFPADLSPAAVDLLKNLLHRDANERLGAGPLDAEEIKRHPFFESVDWDLLLAKKIEPPFKPHLRSHEDSKYFPADVKREPVLSDEGDGPDAAFGTATRRTRTQRSRTPASRSTGNSSRSSNSRVAAATVADPVASGNCTATAYTGTTRQPEDACTEGHSHACSSHSSHNSQHTEDEEGEALFKGFTYDERLQGTWGKAATSPDDPYDF
ncbi:AGC kinase, putative [Eimeria maxima]|uniref:AGC kinase, putative n=1 Tax=Eimeria maxima TaxID=5804 RepID=U6M7N9_EIMMA|nr:AGC kinase, putative [Eimeria maxima]CDJ57685.1 AGC kinase, putative [Eimeria maxima]